MISTGYYCDECREKYATYACDCGLPCGHDQAKALLVVCEAFGRHAEHIKIGDKEVWIAKRQITSPAHNFSSSKRNDNGLFCSAGDYLFWGSEVYRDLQRKIPPILVGEWLSSKDDAFVRAFFFRWDSARIAPDWVRFKSHPVAIRARAVVTRRTGPAIAISARPLRNEL